MYLIECKHLNNLFQWQVFSIHFYHYWTCEISPINPLFSATIGYLLMTGQYFTSIWWFNKCALPGLNSKAFFQYIIYIFSNDKNIGYIDLKCLMCQTLYKVDINFNYQAMIWSLCSIKMLINEIKRTNKINTFQMCAGDCSRSCYQS